MFPLGISLFREWFLLSQRLLCESGSALGAEDVAGNEETRFPASWTSHSEEGKKITSKLYTVVYGDNAHAVKE